MKRIIRISLALLLSFFMCFSDVLCVFVSAEQNSGSLPFSFEETDYGIEVDAVNGKMLNINSQNVSVLDSRLSNLLFLKEKTSGDAYKIHIISPRGLLKTYEFSSENEWVKGISSPHSAAKYFKIFRNGEEEDYFSEELCISGWYTDTIYLVKNADGKYDLINLNTDKYYDYSFDRIEPTDNKRKNSLFVYYIGDKIGFLDCHGNILTDALYAKYNFVYDNNILVYETDSTYSSKKGIITTDGMYKGELVFDVIFGGYTPLALKKDNDIYLLNHLDKPIHVSGNVTRVGSESVFVEESGSQYLYNIDGTKTDIVTHFGGEDDLGCFYIESWANFSNDTGTQKYINICVGKGYEWGDDDVVFNGIVDEKLKTIFTYDDDYSVYRYGDYFVLNKNQFSVDGDHRSIIIDNKGKKICEFNTNINEILYTSRYMYVKFKEDKTYAFISLETDKCNIYDGEIWCRIFDDEFATGGLQYVYYRDYNINKDVLCCLDNGGKYVFLNDGYAAVLGKYFDSEMHIMIRDGNSADYGGGSSEMILNESLEVEHKSNSSFIIISPDIYFNNGEFYKKDGSKLEAEEHYYSWDYKERYPKMTSVIKLHDYDEYVYNFRKEKYVYFNSEGIKLIDDCYFLSEFYDGVGFYARCNDINDMSSDEIGIVNEYGDTLISGNFFNRFFSNSYNEVDKNEYDRCRRIEVGGDGIILKDPDGNYILYSWNLSGEYHSKDRSSVENCSFKTSFNDKELAFYSKNGEGFYYYDSYFDKPATEYQHSLATMSLCMAFSTYGYGSYSGYDKNVKNLMKQCGFAEKGKYKKYHFNEKPSAHSIGCVIGSKEIDDTTVLAVAVRSGGYEEEWVDNFTMGKDGNHHGFDNSASTVKDYIISYITEKHISGNVKIWITGFSRGAAVATATAAKLDDLSGFGYQVDNIEKRVDFDKEDIYAYGFATPAGAISSSNPHSNAYNNIFNIIDYNDPVPLVAPELWGFDRYGKTMVLPYKLCMPVTFSTYSNKIKNKMGWFNYRLDDFVYYQSNVPIKNISVGTYNRLLVYALTLHMLSRKNYEKEYQYQIQSLFSTLEGNQELRIPDAFDLIATKLLPSFSICFPDLVRTLSANLKVLADVHANPQYYVYWMQLMDENYPDHMPLIFGEKNYRILRINCPVDVYVYDSDGKSVGSIVDNQPQYDDKGLETLVDDNGQKIVYLPVGDEYSVEIIPWEDCSVSCGIEEFNTESGFLTRNLNFETVSIDEDQIINAQIGAFSDDEVEEGTRVGSSATYSMDVDGEAVSVVSDISGMKEIASHTYNLSVKFDESKGNVYGGGALIEGSYAVLYAESKPGYHFDGFYIDDVKVDKYTDDNNIRIQVNSDIKLEARFTDCKHKFDEDDYEIIRQATAEKSGQKKYICEICGKEIIKEYTLKDEDANSKSDKSTEQGDNPDGNKNDQTVSEDDFEKFFIDPDGNTYYFTDYLTKDQLAVNLYVSDLNSKGDYKITKLIKKGGKITGGNVTFIRPFDNFHTKSTIPATVKICGVKFNVTEVYKNAFDDCDDLTKVTIGKNVTKIGSNAFKGCKKLKTITIKTSKLKKIGSKAFKGINAKAKFKVPKKKLKKYKKMIKKAGAPKKAKITK